MGSDQHRLVYAIYGDPDFVYAMTRFVLETGGLYGPPKRVAEQIAALRDVGIHHVMCQASWGGLAHDKAVASLRRFGEHVAPKLRDS